MIPTSYGYDREDELKVVMRKFYNLKGNAYITIEGRGWVIDDLLDLLTRQGWTISTIQKQEK